LTGGVPAAPLRVSDSGARRPGSDGPKRKGAKLMDSKKSGPKEEELKCPECRHPLKRRRGRKADACEMLCGGCGRSFDVCDIETLDEIKKGTA
jgi:hypothetical protein